MTNEKIGIAIIAIVIIAVVIGLFEEFSGILLIALVFLGIFYLGYISDKKIKPYAYRKRRSQIDDEGEV